jgi:hypothetical protein
MDIAAFKVSHSIGTDKDATALRAARARSSCIHRGHGTFTHGFDLRESSPPTATQHIATVKTPAGQWDVACVGSIRRKTHEALPRYTANSEHTFGAMERYMSGFDSAQNSPQTANTHTANSEYTFGAMDESSGRVQDASTQNNQRCCHGYCSL